MLAILWGSVVKSERYCFEIRTQKLFCIAFISRDKNTKILAKENNENNLSINQEFLAILVIVIY